jgi:hypothetical protein
MKISGQLLVVIAIAVLGSIRIRELFLRTVLELVPGQPAKPDHRDSYSDR